jgi:hypothetical protein
VTQLTTVTINGQPARLSDLRRNMRVMLSVSHGGKTADKIDATDPPNKKSNQWLISRVGRDLSFGFGRHGEPAKQHGTDEPAVRPYPQHGADELAAFFSLEFPSALRYRHQSLDKEKPE